MRNNFFNKRLPLAKNNFTRLRHHLLPNQGTIPLLPEIHFLIRYYAVPMPYYSVSMLPDIPYHTEEMHDSSIKRRRSSLPPAINSESAGETITNGRKPI